MEIWQVITEILLLLGVAFVFGFLAQWLKQSAVIGYLIAGALLGPIMFSRHVVSGVAELGVSLLLFSIGLEFSFRRFKSMGSVALAGGTLQVLATMLVFGFLFALRFPFRTALVLGAMVALSSTAVVLRILIDRTEIDSIRGRNALGILLVQDIAVVPLVLLVAMLSHGGDLGDIFIRIAQTVAAALGLVITFYLLFYHLIPRVLLTRGLFSNRELVVLLTIVMALGSTWLAHALGLSPALGAFLAGMLLAESPFAGQIRSDIGSLRTLFVTLFFTSIGMLANPGWFFVNWSSVAFWLLIVFLGKAAVIYAVCLIFKITHNQALATGFTLAQIGEFSFVLATAAKSGGLISDEIFSLIISITILSLFFAPYMVAYALPLADGVLGSISGRYRRKTKRFKRIEKTPGGHIGIIGFGPAGQRVADALLDQGLQAVVVELNPRTAAIAGNKGLRVCLGDAAHFDVIAGAGLNDTCVAVITVPDPRTAGKIIENLRLVAPNSTIIVRGRYHIARADLQQSGASLIVDEENMIGRELAREVIRILKHKERDAFACAIAGQVPEHTDDGERK